jgi:hypothetical protein
MGSLREAGLILSIIKQRLSPSPLNSIRLIRVIRGLNSGLHDLDLPFDVVKT